MSASADEPRWSPGERPEDYLRTCVDAKWQSALSQIQAQPLDAVRRGLLVGDTVVVLGKDILGKPESPEEAFSMLRRLSGQTHLVWTGLRMGRYIDDQLLARDDVVESRVHFRELSDDEIHRYIETDKPFDKAGAYGFQDRALRFVARVEGSYSNIVGLPVESVRRLAKDLRFV